jgi:hypothetical protein
MATVVEALRLAGWLVYHTHDSRRSAPGYPDLTCVRGDRILWLELKTETGRLSQAQANWLAALGTAGGSVHVVRPPDWPWLEELLR